MGICISTAKQCISTGEEVVDDFINRQSRFYKESELAKEHLSQKKQTGNDSHINDVLQSDISPIYPSLPKGAKKYHCRNVYDGDTITLEDNSKTGIKIRLIGIDTPEIKEKQPFSIEAKEYTKKYCHNKDVWISARYGTGQPTLSVLLRRLASSCRGCGRRGCGWKSLGRARDEPAAMGRRPSWP